MRSDDFDPGAPMRGSHLLEAKPNGDDYPDEETPDVGEPDFEESEDRGWDDESTTVGDEWEEDEEEDWED